MLLVTGITGHTGGYFLQELIKNKYDGPIRCVVRETSNTSLLDKSGLNVEKVVGNLNDPGFIARVMNGIDTIMHIYNIHHSPMIVQTAIEKKVNRAILVHTTGIHSEFKRASEGYKLIEKKINELKSDLTCSTNITILRPSMIYGDIRDRNISKFIKMVDKLKIIPVIEGGKSLVQPVNARDLGKAFFDVLISPEKTDGKVYDLSGKRPIKMIDTLKLVSKELDKKITYVNIPLSFGVLMARAFKYLTLRRIDFTEKVQRMGEDRTYSHDNATKDFGYYPMAFEEGIQIEVAEYLEAKKEK